ELCQDDEPGDWRPGSLGTSNEHPRVGWHFHRGRFVAPYPFGTTATAPLRRNASDRSRRMPDTFRVEACRMIFLRSRANNNQNTPGQSSTYVGYVTHRHAESGQGFDHEHGPRAKPALAFASRNGQV